MSGLVENVGVEDEIASLSQAVQFAFYVFTAAILDFRLPVARDSIASSTVGFLDLENWEIAVRISFLCVIQLEVCLGFCIDPALGAPRQ